MNEFANVNPQSWLDENQVLVVRLSASKQAPQVRGLVSEVRGLLSSALFGLSVVGVASYSYSSSDHIVRSQRVANAQSENGVSRRYWAGLARAMDQAPEIADYEESDEVAPLL